MRLRQPILALLLTSALIPATAQTHATTTSMTDVVTPIHYGEIIGDVAKGFAGPADPLDSTPLDGGNLDFLIDGIEVCSLPFISGITQTCPPTTGAGYSAGTYALSATYTGNSYYAPSSSPGYPVTVLPDDTQGTLATSGTPAIFGSTVTLAATFTAAFATPTGTVTFYDGATPIGIASLNATGIATFNTATLAVGTHSLTATLGVSRNFNPSTTFAITQQIDPAPLPTTTTLTSSINPSIIGQQVTFIAAVSSTAPVVAGSITIFIDGATAYISPISAQGTAAFAITTLPLGNHNVTATYSGATASGVTFTTSTSPTLVQIVNAVGNSFTFTATPNPISVPIGNTATALVTVNDLTGFTQPVILSCSGLPRAATCLFSNPTIPAGGGSSTLFLSASAPHDCDNNTPYFITPAGPTTWLALIATATALLTLRRRKLLVRALVIALALWIIPALSGCGHCTDLGVPPGTYTFTLTATSTGSPVITKTQTITMKAHL